MESAALWLTPLVLLPGVALLVISTSQRYGQIHEEVHRLVERDASSERAFAHLLRRASLFRNALVSLYLAVALFALASVLGAVAELWRWDARLIVFAMSCLGILAVLFGALELIRESMISLQVIREHGAEWAGS